MQNEETTVVGTIDCTPTWQGILPYYLLVLQDGTPEGQKIAKAELNHMAKVADMAKELLEEKEDLADAINGLLCFIEGGNKDSELLEKAKLAIQTHNKPLKK